jgi:hypothetical protein
VSAPGDTDLEFTPDSVSVYQYKKVTSSGTADNFYSVLVLDFDPATLNLSLKLEGACGVP